MTDPLILVRALHFAATLLAGGTVVFLALAAKPLPDLEQRLVRLTWWALGGAVLSGAAWLVLLAADIIGTSVADTVLSGGVWSVLTGTRFGQVASARLALAILLAALLARPRMRVLQMLVVLPFAALPAWTGHAGAGLGAAGFATVAADALHLVAAASWLGALPALAIFLGVERRPPQIATVAARFSRLGIAAVAALVATGLANAWSLVGSLENLVATDYGRLLLLKVGLFLAMLALAAVNHFHLTPRLAVPGALRNLLRITVVESALGIGLLLLVGALGTLPPAAHRAVSASGTSAEASYLHLHSTEAMADLMIEPGRETESRATIRLTREDGSEFPAQAVQLELDPRAGGAPIAREAVRGPDGTWDVPELDRPAPGTWTVKILIRRETGGELLLDGPLAIAR